MAATNDRMTVERGEKPKTNLLHLPYEIKDQIYDNLFHEKYKVIPTYIPSKEIVSHFRLSDVAILQVSKRVNHDTKKALFSWSVFKIEDLFVYLYQSPSAFIDPIMNVEFTIAMSWHIQSCMIADQDDGIGIEPEPTPEDYDEQGC